MLDNKTKTKSTTKTETKYAAQEALLYFAASAFYDAECNGGTTPEYIEELRRQYKRIEKLFGIVPGTTNH